MDGARRLVHGATAYAPLDELPALGSEQSPTPHAASGQNTMKQTITCLRRQPPGQCELGRGGTREHGRTAKMKVAVNGGPQTGPSQPPVPLALLSDARSHSWKQLPLGARSSSSSSPAAAVAPASSGCCDRCAASTSRGPVPRASDAVSPGSMGNGKASSVARARGGDEGCRACGRVHQHSDANGQWQPRGSHFPFLRS